MARHIVGGKIKIDELVNTVINELDDFNTYVSNVAIREAVKKTSAEAVKQLRATSPERTGDYAKSWDNQEAFRPQKYRYSEIVYAGAPEYRVTHLLENGHKKRNNKGWVEAQPHIGQVEEQLEGWLVKFLKGEIEQ